MATSRRPLEGIRVVDLGHTVMGPSCGMILADLGAEVIKLEAAPDGDPTRRLKGFGIGYFGYFNRNKRSAAIDLKTAEGREVAHRLIDTADVLIENFAPGTMERLGIGHEEMTRRNPRLIFASLKGFLEGPYDKRLALDEVVQMMTGLAFMTGPSGRPLRAGTSVIDVAGGMFAVIAILVALRERDRTGRGGLVESALFETAVFLMGQHLCYAAQSDTPLPPMPERVSAWAVYDTFALADGQQIFVGITADNQWRRFCAVAGRPDLIADPDLATNNQRIERRGPLLEQFRALFAGLTLDKALALCEAAQVPFAPVARPEDLFDDPHLAATGGLLPTVLPDGTRTRLPRLPVGIEGVSLDLRGDPPAVGADTRNILHELGYSAAEIRDLEASRSVRLGDDAAEPAAVARAS